MIKKQVMQHSIVTEGCINGLSFYYKMFTYEKNIIMPPVDNKGLSPMQIIEKCISENKVMIFSKTTCSYCEKVKDLFTTEQITFEALELNNIENGDEIQNALEELTGQRTVPNIYILGKHVGDATKVFDLFENDRLFALLYKKTHDFDYDYVVIGGGPGGLASAKEASKYLSKVAVCDFFDTSSIGTEWGLGGTCLNVGCIPYKLMHQAGLKGHDLMDSPKSGWNDIKSVTHNWGKLVKNIQNYTKSLNRCLEEDMKDKNIHYFKSFATFVDHHTIKTVDKNGNAKTLTAEKFLIAVGGRPRYPDVPGAKEYCITSEDISSLPHAPGKTLVVGASKRALECAGFLAAFGYDVTVMVRAILLRAYDQQMANKIGEILLKRGVKFIKETVLTKIEQIEQGNPQKLRVTGVSKSGDEFSDQFNTVLLAVGRDPNTTKLGLEKAQVDVSETGKIIVDNSEMTSQPNIFAVGDVREGGVNLTPVATLAGKLLARRLFGNSKILMDYNNVPTVTFTSVEYGSCGYTEEAAIEKFGGVNTKIYEMEFSKDIFCKLIVNTKDNMEGIVERLVGFHYIGSNAGEITQGFAIAVKMRVSKAIITDIIDMISYKNKEVPTRTIRFGEDAVAKGY